MAEILIKIIRSGEIIIPKEIRRKYNLHEGDYLILYDEGDKIVFKKAKIVPE
jgi:AbrB family looped-hinge helix DNA binding protein